MPIVSDYFPEHPFYSISSDRAAASFGNHQAKPVDIDRIPFVETLCFIPFGRGFRAVENKPLASENVTAGKNGFYIFCSFQPTGGR